MNRLRRRLATIMTTALATTAAAALTASPASAGPPIPTSLTASVSATTVDAGQSTTVSGQLTQQTSTGWAAVTGGDIQVRVCVDPSCSQSWGGTSTQTTTGGYYTATFAPPRTGYLRLIFQPDPFTKPWHVDLVGTSTTTPQVNVLQLSNHSTISAARQSDGQVLFYGLIGFPSYVLPPTAPVIRIEFSADGVTWGTVNTVTSRPFHNGHYVYTAYTAEPASGYWRGVYDGLPAHTKASSTSAAHVA